MAKNQPQLTTAAADKASSTVVVKKKSRLSKPLVGNGTRRAPKVTKEKLCALIHYISQNENGGNGANKDVVAKRAGYISATSPAFSMAITRQKRNGLIYECCPTDKKMIEVTDVGRDMVLNGGLLSPSAMLDRSSSSNAASARSTMTNNSNATTTVSNEEHHRKLRAMLRHRGHYHRNALVLFDLLSDGLARSRVEVAATLGFDSPAAAALSFLLAQMHAKGLVEWRNSDDSYGHGGGGQSGGTIGDWIMLTDYCFPHDRP